MYAKSYNLFNGCTLDVLQKNNDKTVEQESDYSGEDTPRI